MNILLTGGSSGLGLAIIKKLAKDPNNTIYFTYRSHKDVAMNIEKVHANTFAIHCDFSVSDSINALLERIPKLNIDVLINNAYTGVTNGNHFYKISADDFAQCFKLNVLPTISITQKVFETLRKKKSGRIITILTSALLDAPPIGYSVYTATKAYIAQLTKSWSKEFIRFGISSNTISPNFMQTELTKETNSFIIEEMEKTHPLKRLLKVDEVADVVNFLLHATNQINGVDIPLNAGISIK